MDYHWQTRLGKICKYFTYIKRKRLTMKRVRATLTKEQTTWSQRVHVNTSYLLSSFATLKTLYKWK